MPSAGRGVVAMVALAMGAFVNLVGVAFVVAAALGGGSGGATAFLGGVVTLVLSCVALLAGIVGAALGPAGRARWMGLGAIGLSLAAPVLFVALVALLIPPSAFRI